MLQKVRSRMSRRIRSRLLLWKIHSKVMLWKIGWKTMRAIRRRETYSPPVTFVLATFGFLTVIAGVLLYWLGDVISPRKTWYLVESFGTYAGANAWGMPRVLHGAAVALICGGGALAFARVSTLISGCLVAVALFGLVRIGEVSVRAHWYWPAHVEVYVPPSGETLPPEFTVVPVGTWHYSARDEIMEGWNEIFERDVNPVLRRIFSGGFTAGVVEGVGRQYRDIASGRGVHIPGVPRHDRKEPAAR